MNKYFFKKSNHLFFKSWCKGIMALLQGIFVVFFESATECSYNMHNPSSKPNLYCQVNPSNAILKRYSITTVQKNLNEH